MKAQTPKQAAGGSAVEDPQKGPAPGKGSRIPAARPLESDGSETTDRSSAIPFASLIGLERATGADLSGVRLHTGPQAAAKAEEQGAHAFAEGDDITFNSGFDPTTASGQHLLAHETAHVVQQRGGSTRVDRKSISEPQGHSNTETEADAFADAFVENQAVPTLSQSNERRSLKKKNREEEQTPYPGQYQSLSRTGVQNLGDSDVAAGMLGARSELGQFGGAIRGDRQRNLTVLQWEAQQRGLGERSPEVNPAEVINVAGVSLSADPVHLRFVLEAEIATSGLGAPERLIDVLEREVRDLREKAESNAKLATDLQHDEDTGFDTVSAGVPLGAEQEQGNAEELELKVLVLEALRSQAGQIRYDNMMFAGEFERQATATANSILDQE